jgi:hypothetical protein
MEQKTVEVDIYLDDFDLDEILEELRDRIDNKLNGKKTKEDILDFFDDLIPNKALNSTMVDDWKDELWTMIKEKFSIEQLEAFLNS